MIYKHLLDDSKQIEWEEESISVIVKVMDMFIKKDNMCCNCCELLSNIAVNGKQSTIIAITNKLYIERNKMIISNGEAISIILKVINAYTDDLYMCIQGSETLWRIFTNNGNL